MIARVKDGPGYWKLERENRLKRKGYSASSIENKV